MKYVLLLFLKISISFPSVCQSPKWADFKLFAGQSHDDGNTIAIDKNGNIYLAVSSQNPLSSFSSETLPEVCNFIQPIRGNLYHGAVFRFDTLRNLTLSIIIEKATLGDIAVDHAGNIYVSGVLQYGASRDAFVKKYSSTGSLIWSKSLESAALGRSSDNVITSMALSHDGALAISGFSYGDQVSLLGQLNNGPFGFVTKVSTSGELIWTHYISQQLGYGVYRVKFDAAGDVLVTGNQKAPGTNNILSTIAKFEGATGTTRWEEQLHSNGLYVPRGTAIGVAADYYVFGGTYGGEITVEGTTLTSEGGMDIYLLRCDKDGNIDWVKTAGSTGRETLRDLVVTNNSIYFTGGFSDCFKLNGTTYTSKGNTDVYIGALNQAGNTRWVLTGGSNMPHQNEDLAHEEYGASLAVDATDQLQLVGTTIGSGSFGSLQYKAPEEALKNAFWLTLGSQTASYTVIYPCDRNSVLEIALQVYPNPFMESLTISNTLGLDLNYKLVLTNSIGQKLAEKHYTTASIITIHEWSTLAAGVYFLSIDTGEHSNMFKLVKR